MDAKRKIGIVVGRFQPLHDGHIKLIRIVLGQNDFTVICIGSSQIADPLTFKERVIRVHTALDGLGYARDRYRIIALSDINDLPRWPTYLKSLVGLTDETENRYYLSDNPSEDFRKYLEEAGFMLVVLERGLFSYKGPDGRHYIVNSATEIRRLHRELGKMDKI